MSKKKQSEVAILDLVCNYCESCESVQAVWSEIERISDDQSGVLVLTRMDTEFIRALGRLNDDLQGRTRRTW